MGVKSEEEIVSQVDLHVKSQVMTDTLNLMLKSKKQRIEIEDKYRSLNKVMPTDDADHSEIGEIIHSVRQLFYKLCSIRDHMNLSSGQFEKLH